MAPIWESDVQQYIQDMQQAFEPLGAIFLVPHKGGSKRPLRPFRNTGDTASTRDPCIKFNKSKLILEQAFTGDCAKVGTVDETNNKKIGLLMSMREAEGGCGLIVVDIDNELACNALADCFPAMKETTMQKTTKGAHFIFKRTRECDQACLLDMPRGLQPCNDEGCVCRSTCMLEQGKSGKCRLVVDIKTKASTGTGGILDLAPSEGKSWTRPPNTAPPLDFPESLVEFVLSHRSVQPSNKTRKRMHGNARVWIDHEEVHAPLSDAALQEAEYLISRLGQARSDNRSSWLDVGRCACYMDARLYGAWLLFSQKSDKYVDEDDCLRVWRSFSRGKHNGYSIMNLVSWMIEDNYKVGTCFIHADSDSDSGSWSDNDTHDEDNCHQPAIKAMRLLGEQSGISDASIRYAQEHGMHYITYGSREPDVDISNKYVQEIDLRNTALTSYVPRWALEKRMQSYMQLCSCWRRNQKQEFSSSAHVVPLQCQCKGGCERLSYALIATLITSRWQRQMRVNQQQMALPRMAWRRKSKSCFQALKIYQGPTNSSFHQNPFTSCTISAMTFWSLMR